MASSNALAYETIFEGQRVKIYKISHDNNSDTSEAITPGKGFGYPIGGYTEYTEAWDADAGWTYTFLVVDANQSAYTNIMFLAL
jgi:hypothetical protein